MLFRALTATFVMLAAGNGVTAASAAGYHSNPSAWTIGPIIKGRNYSKGMPLRPSPARRGGMQIDIPRAPGSVHYVTFRHGSLAGKSRIVMRYRIEGEPGARIVPTTVPTSPSMITLYFQRGGDNWSARGRFEAYRWYASFATQSPLTPGEHVLVAPLNGNWTAVQSSNARTNRAAFGDALANADQVGFVLGGGDGLGHGVSATGRARLIVTDFRVE
jgi:hypothetical protein